MVCPKKFVDLAVYSCPLTLEKTNSRIFEEKLVLSGHSNWINDIAMTTIGNFYSLIDERIVLGIMALIFFLLKNSAYDIFGSVLR